MLRVGFGQGAVEGCDGGVFSGVLPALDLQLLCDVGDGCALVTQSTGEDGHVRVDDLRSSAVVASRGGGQLTFEGLLADVVAVELRSDALPALADPGASRNLVPDYPWRVLGLPWLYPILTEVMRREALYNEGNQYSGGAKRLAPGRRVQ